MTEAAAAPMDELGDYLRIPATFNMAAAALDRWVAAGEGSRPAFHFEGRGITYQELSRQANRFGNALRRLGMRPGDTFLIRSHNVADYCAAILGAMKVGVVPLLCSSLFGQRELAHVFRNGTPRGIVTTGEHLDAMAGVLEEVGKPEWVLLFEGERPGCRTFADLVGGEAADLETLATSPDAPAFTLYTSGTTGTPKGIVHAHRWLIGAGDTNARYFLRLTRDDVMWVPAELSFMYGLYGMFMPLYRGASFVLYRGRVTPQAILETVQQYRVTVIAAIPTSYRMILAMADVESKYDLSSLRLTLASGETTAPETYNEWHRRFGQKLLGFIGISELTGFCGNVPWREPKPGSLGQPYLGFTVKVLDEDGREVPPGQPGNLCVREDAAAMFVEYRKMPDKMRECRRHGYYYTGDLASVDEDGYFWYVSRADDLIKTRGYLVAPKEVEDTISEHPGIAEVGVVGTPDPITNMRVKAFILLRPGWDPTRAVAEEIRALVRERIAAYKAPKEVEFVPEIAKTVTGKINRRELRSQLTSRGGPVFDF